MDKGSHGWRVYLCSHQTPTTMKRHCFWIVACTLWLSPMAASAQALQLDDCLAKARANYPAVARYGLIERARDYTLSNAAKGWLPQIGLSAGAYAFTDILDADALTQIDMDNYLLNAAVSVSQPLYDGGKSQSERRVARAQAEAEARQLDAELYDVDERVEQLFFGVLLLDVQLVQNGLLQDDLSIGRRTVESMLAGGIANEGDVEAVAVEQLQAQQQASALAAGRRAYVRMLSIFIGETLAEDVALATPSVPATGEGLRPELTAFAARESLLDAQRKQLNVRLRPTLSAFATGSLHSQVTDLANQGVLLGGVTLSWNIGALYTRHNDLQLLDVQRMGIDTERETFLFNNRLERTDSNAAIESLREQLEQDSEIVRLREAIRGRSEAKVQLGTESVNDMLRDINAVSQARQQQALHEMQLLKEIYNHNHITGLSL